MIERKLFILAVQQDSRLKPKSQNIYLLPRVVYMFFLNIMLHIQTVIYVHNCSSEFSRSSATLSYLETPL